MNAYTRQDLSVMQAWPLDRKIRVTQAKIIEWYHHYGGKVAVSFSGGKDSTVLLDLARRAFPDIPAVFVDTGLEYPEIREFVKTVPNVTWLRPEMPFSKVILAIPFPCLRARTCALISQKGDEYEPENQQAAGGAREEQRQNRRAPDPQQRNRQPDHGT